MTWRETLTRLRADRDRLQALVDGEPGGEPGPLWSSPSFQCVVLYRLSQLSFANGHRLVGRLFWHLNLLLTGADISMMSDFGPGLVVRAPAAINVFCRAGRDCTLHGTVVIGGGTSRRDDIGSGPGLPVLGDGVEVEWGAVVLGPITVGHRARIGAGCVVSRDVPEGADIPPGARHTQRTA